MSVVHYGEAPAGRLGRTLLAAGFALGIVGGPILGASYVADLPDTAVAAGWLSFVVGLVMAFAFRDNCRCRGS
jgi:hypothetical protein